MSVPRSDPAAEFPGFTLRDGRRIQIRHSRAEDAESVAEAMATASSRTLRNRFFSALHSLPLTELRALLEANSSDACCLVATLDDRVIGGARFVRLGDLASAEIAVTVHDTFQGQGLGTALMRELIGIARQRGIRLFTGEALNDNQAVIALLSRFGPVRITRQEPGVRHLEVELN
jgi:ribosomal protein S18 acetylase RimI-like enzyme